MDLEQLRQILDLVKQHNLSEFEVEHEGLRLRIRKDLAGSHVLVPLGAAHPPVAAAATDPVPAPPVVASSGPEPLAADEVELAIVKSPIVGTFYRSPEPDAAAFVEIGAMVKKGQVLCIIEAMKLMNEIDSEYDGQVVNVYVESGQPVQYGERLFAIRTL
ncbi:MAG: acetyl-CoA carboxylase biotin carboxyl carrier protein [Acidobacteriota bacterium]